MNVVVVESPAKAKTINKYLGGDYIVLASYGHVRDLPPKDGSVRPDDDFAMSWDVDAKSAKRLNDIADAMKGADRLILATDPDREGEAISWHLKEVLEETKKLKNIGSDLGGAVKGFKDGMKGADDVAAEQAVPPQQVTQRQASNSQTVDVEAKTKS